MDGFFLGHIPCSLVATVKSLRNVVNYRSRSLGLLRESLCRMRSYIQRWG